MSIYLLCVLVSLHFKWLNISKGVRLKYSEYKTYLSHVSNIKIFITYITVSNRLCHIYVSCSLTKNAKKIF